ncbi:MAG: hypothetical protein AAB480_03230 [Patescibacteria group bacterium]
MNEAVPDRTNKTHALREEAGIRSFDAYRERFRSFYDAIASDHRESVRQHRGHGLDHDVTVAQLAAHIAPDERTAEKAWCAGMLHSTDRYAAIAKVSEGPHEVGEEIMQNLKYIPPGYFSSGELSEMYAAACRHDELNQEDQSTVQMALMDADRLVNLMNTVVIRAGQFQPGIPAFESEHLNGRPNPGSTYHSPKSVLDDLRIMIKEYLPQLRLSKAKAMGERLRERMERLIQSIEKDPRIAVIITAGQSRPEIPAFEFTFLSGRPNPESTADHPKSVLDDLRLRELEASVRTRVDEFIHDAERDYRDLGLNGLAL